MDRYEASGPPLIAPCDNVDSVPQHSTWIVRLGVVGHVVSHCRVPNSWSMWCLIAVFQIKLIREGSDISEKKMIAGLIGFGFSGTYLASWVVDNLIECLKFHHQHHQPLAQLLSHFYFRHLKIRF